MKKLLITLLLSIAALTSVHAGMIDDVVKRGTLRVALDPAFPPFEMTTTTGEIIGFDVDLLKAMAKALDVKLEIVTTAFDGIIPGLLTEKFDIVASGMTVTQERNIRINFSDPYINMGVTVLINKNIADEVKSYKDLNNPKYRLTAKMGTTGEIVVKKLLRKAKYNGYDSETEAVLDVVNGKADAFIYDASYNFMAIKKLGSDKLVHLDEPFTYEPIAFAIRRGDYDSINWINNFLHRIKNDGTYDRLHKKWFKDMNWINDIK